ncbi:MAG: type II toxin-antitoxin system HigB family toxin [Flavobacteriales bacterium]
MKVRLVLEETIYDYCRKNARAKSSFTKFMEALQEANWYKPDDILKTFNHTDILNCKRVVFNVGGNNYRLICAYAFGKKYVHLFIKFIGTHAEYDKVDVCKIEIK